MNSYPLTSCYLDISHVIQYFEKVNNIPLLNQSSPYSESTIYDILGSGHNKLSVTLNVETATNHNPITESFNPQPQTHKLTGKKTLKVHYFKFSLIFLQTANFMPINIAQVYKKIIALSLVQFI